MADNVPITAGSGTTIATDDVSGVHYQYVKIVDGTAEGTTKIAGSSRGLKVDDRPLLERVTVDSSGLTTASTAYTAGDQLGPLLELTNMAIASGGEGIIHSVRLLDDAAVTLGVEAFFFDRSVTVASDNAAFAISDADMAYCQGSIIIPAGSSATNNTMATLTGMMFDYECNATSLFVALKTLNGHTFFAATDDLHLKVTVSRLS